MSELKWLDGYSGQTTDELIALEGEYRPDAIVLAFEEALQQKLDRVGHDGLTEEERVVLAVEALEREVNNGGYDAFFAHSNEFASIVVDALNRIDRVKVAKLTQEAIDALKIKGPLTAEAIEKAMNEDDDERDERFEACDHRYYESAGDLAEPLLAYIRQNNRKFLLSV